MDAQMKTANVTELEVDLLLDAIYERYHYDFRHYARSCLVRRVARAQSIVGSSTVTQLLDRVVHDPETFTTVLHCLTIQVSDLFRDPEYYRALRDSVLPHLRTYPSIRIWVAGCGTGEEAYSFAIMLQEEGLLDRALIYATDIDVESLATAGLGAYPDDRVRRFSQNYFQAGGRASLSDYYTAAYSRVAFRPELRRRILFSDHCLATDAAFAEMQLVSCRNVLIYFDRELQNRVVRLFEDSLCPRGFLGLGAKESLVGTRYSGGFEPFAAAEKIYRLKRDR